jgi:predicted DNA binding protein
MKAAEICLRPPQGAFPGVDSTLADTDGVCRERVLQFDWLEDGGLLLLYEVSAAESAAVTGALDSDESVRRYELVDRSAETLCLFIHADRSDLFADLLDVVEEYALLFRGPYEWTEAGLNVTLAGEDAALREVHDRVTDRFEVTIGWIGPYTPAEPGPLAKLTTRQREALATAYDLGFYETPRDASYEDLAAALECVPSAANDLLRRSEASLVAAVLDH